MLNPTPPEKLCDPSGRPMRQARPDDALVLVSLTQIRTEWERVLPYLGHRRAFWTWLIPELERRAG
jgi:hypothetical protein